MQFDQEQKRQMALETLKKMPYSDLRETFEKHLSTMSPEVKPVTIKTWASDALYLYRKEGADQFWDAVESDDGILEHKIIAALKQHGGAESNIKFYCRGIMRFKAFARQWIDSEIVETISDNPANSLTSGQNQKRTDNKQTVSWIIPCNPKYYDVFGAFDNLKSIDWSQSASSISVGDTIYIYVGQPIQAIMFKTRVIAVNLTGEEIDYSDQDFNLTNQDSYSMKRSMRLVLERKYTRDDLSFDKLVKCGLKGNIQGPRRVNASIQELIDAVESEQASQISQQNGNTQNESHSKQDIKETTESTLRMLTAGDVNFNIESHKTQTSVRWKNVHTIIIYYRSDALRVGMKDTPAIHAIYDELSAKGYAYQRSTADPNSEPGKYFFFIDSEKIENALPLLIIAVQNDKLTGKSISASVPSSMSKQNIQPSVAQDENTIQIIKQLQSVAAFSHSADNQRIERKIDSLIGAIASMNIPQVNSERSEPEVISKSYRIEPTSGDSPILIIRSKPIITGLVFTLKIATVGFKTDPEQYRIFFSTSNCKQLSDPQEFAAVAGEEQTCRFMLKTSASEEKKIFLVVQGADAEEDEARQLIAFDVNMAFSADFDL